MAAIKINIVYEITGYMYPSAEKLVELCTYLNYIDDLESTSYVRHFDKNEYLLSSDAKFVEL